LGEKELEEEEGNFGLEKRAALLRGKTTAVSFSAGRNIYFQTRVSKRPPSFTRTASLQPNGGGGLIGQKNRPRGEF
jgi:hypothetical protein